MVELHLGDCEVAMSFNMARDSVDAIVTDPPYELGFMGKGWDRTGIANDVDMWRAAFDVLKPGGHLLAFSGTRTYHHMVCAIEDAGFEIRDQMAWVYGSGFPKSLDVSKAIDKAAGAEREKVRVKPRAETCGTMAGSSDSRPWIERSREVGYHEVAGDIPVTAAAAAQWQGWGTALKPAWEPIVVARKPLIGTVAENVLQHGTGAINVDGCRIAAPGVDLGRNNNARTSGTSYVVQRETMRIDNSGGLGRWPANLIHDGSDEVLAAFPQAPGQMAAASTSDTQRAGQNVYGVMMRGSNGAQPRIELDKSAARFFYCAKASKTDRGEGNTHPTVKPIELMRYLCRLITPPGGLVLDPFMGSGSTGKAAMLEGFRFIGVEMSAEYMEIARQRLGLLVPAQDIDGEDDLW